MKLAMTNVPPRESARLARALVEERLAACVSRLPVQSVYRWRGELCEDEEHTLLIKVAAERVDALRARLLALHPYELPEFVVLDVDRAGSLAAYVDWVRAESSGEVTGE